MEQTKIYIENQLFFLDLCFRLLFKRQKWSSEHYKIFKRHLGNNISKRKWAVLDLIMADKSR